MINENISNSFEYKGDINLNKLKNNEINELKSDQAIKQAIKNTPISPDKSINTVKEMLTTKIVSKGADNAGLSDLFKNVIVKPQGYVKENINPAQAVPAGPFDGEDYVMVEDDISKDYVLLEEPKEEPPDVIVD